MQETIRLYTRQNEKTLLMLERDGRIINRRIYVQLHFGDMAWHYLECYDWFAEQAAKKVPRPADVELPIWCASKRESCLPPIEGAVIYVIDVPRDGVIFFDDAKWDYVLNHHYIPKDGRDAEEYIKDLEARGIENAFEFFEGRYAGKYPDEVRKIKASWGRVFEVDDMPAASVSANIWEIRRENIVEIIDSDGNRIYPR